MLALYGHPFSSYTWKALIALYANDKPFEFRVVDDDHPENGEFVATQGGPLAKFPVLEDGESVIFESTSIIEYLDAHFAGEHPLIPGDRDAAIGARMLDRVFDNYVMSPMQAIVEEYIASSDAPDLARTGPAKQRLRRSYAWLEGWLAYYPAGDQITLVECAAAPALFYADWVEPIGADCPRLAAWRKHLLALPPVKRCVEAARPYRHFFPPGAPDRD
ncbi:MAG: glutathione S-transferase family protein [Novosphingobium sp.]|nr:glutathione S-transferase family protein [Novosphingobium sp.]